MSAMLFHEHVCCAFGAGRDDNDGLLSRKWQARSVCKQKKTCATPFPIGGKRHHSNQSQNYMAIHVIWLLRNRAKLWEGGKRVTATVTIVIASFES